MKKKLTKKEIIETILRIFILLFLVFLFCYLQRMRCLENWYPMDTVVVQVDQSTNTVTIKDDEGNLWQFKDVKGWEEGHHCNCLMDNNRTTTKEDDKILKVFNNENDDN